ncbi:hypothetical protein CCR87_05725 [Rhodobaculum claviforme]|uniref:Uncharacterized protein n=1 Tax=Rhodobaculum claviforme TaxID=1549854 RepID=A0A934WIT8_9RHOB|nr:hypothetical protein [Rhodobaculum claviforme]
MHLAGVGECFVSALPFADDRMRKDLAPALPQLLSILPLEGGDRLEIYRRPQGSILLQDLLEHGARTGRCFAPQDLAWVVSGLMSIAEWLDWAGQAHGCIDATSVFVNPETQAVALLGGWEFSVPFGHKPSALPKRTLELLPQMQLGGRADGRIALKQIQALGRDLLGFDAGGAALPEPVQRWLSWPRTGEVQRDHAGWIAATEEAWGPHKLLALGVSERDVYRH